MADIREQDLALKTTIADTDWVRLVTPTGNHRMTVGQFKDLIGYTALQQEVNTLKQKAVLSETSGLSKNGTPYKIRWNDLEDTERIQFNPYTVMRTTSSLNESLTGGGGVLFVNADGNGIGLAWNGTIWKITNLSWNNKIL